MNGAYEYNIDDLVQRYGSPLFIVSADAIKINLSAFRKRFSDKYPNVEIAYSYKVNCLPGILEIIHRDRTWAEVASGFEYELARRMGVSGASIVFNGPYKRKEELEKALDGGALINVDNRDELETIEEIASERGKPVNIGVRINTDVGINQLPDRFGFNLESGEAARALRQCRGKKLLRVIGLQIHLTSYIIEPDGEDDVPAKSMKLIWPKGPEAYERAAGKVVSFAKEIRKLYGIEIKYIDMGGGFPTVDSLSPYVEAIVWPILDGFKQSELPLLILEPGRAIVSDAVDLISTVVAAKEAAGGERTVTIDSGVNLLPTSYWRYQKLECVGELRGESKCTTVYGPLCLQTDIVCRAELPELRPGDTLIIKNVGAYNIPQSSTFIFPRPTVLLIEDGKATIIRRAEEVESILSL